MDVNVISSIAINILNCEINDKLVENDIKKQLSSELLKGVYKLLKFHDLNHVLFNFIKKNDIEVPSEFAKILKNDYLSAVLKSENVTFETRNVSKILSDTGVKHVILKGEELKGYYPKGFIRPSADIDVLVEENSLSKALKALKSNLEVVSMERNYHDVTIVLDNGIIIELHFTLSENDDRLDRVTEGYLDNLEKVVDFKYKFNNEFTVAYLITHIAYHFYNGGCGIKSFIDLHLIKSKINYDENIVISYLEKGNLTVFYKKVFELIGVWFNKEVYDETTLEMERFVLNGGAYGSFYQSQKSTENFKNRIIKKIFLPYKTLCNYYPVLKKACILYPFFIVVRCFKVVFSKEKRERVKNQINAKEIDNKDKIISLFKELNLN